VDQHGNASGSILLGLDGFEVTAAEVTDDEWRLAVQTTATTVGCAACGTQARLHARRTVRVRDLPIGGRPVVLTWRKRVWRCVEPACTVRTWTEQTVAIRPRAVLTERARAEACRRVGKDAHAVAAVARDLGVGWATIMRAVGDHHAGGGGPWPAAGGRSGPPGRCRCARAGREQLPQCHPPSTDPLRHRPGGSGGWSAAGRHR
jgi:hypothetical protein